MELKGRVVHTGVKHLTAIYTDILKKVTPVDRITILSFTDVTPAIRSARIDGISFAIREKLGIDLYWTKDNGEEYLFPMEGKSYFGFEKFEYLNCPHNATGLHAKFFNIDKVEFPAGIFILVKLVKQ